MITRSDENYKRASRLVRKQMALTTPEGIDEDTLAAWADLGVADVLPVTSGLPGPWPRSVMVAISVVLAWPPDGLERIVQGAEPSDFDGKNVDLTIQDLLADDRAVQAYHLMSYIGEELQVPLLAEIRSVVDQVQSETQNMGGADGGR